MFCFSVFLPSSSFNLFISSCSSFVDPVTFSLILALFFINFALWMNFRVEIVSGALTIDVEIFAIIDVWINNYYTLEFPPKESLRKNVNLESRNGTNFPSTIAFMTFSSVDRDLLIPPASLTFFPFVLLVFVLSEPARSIKCNLDCFWETRPFEFEFKLNMIVKTKWERELSEFMLVAATWRFFNPRRINSKAIFSSSISCSTIPSTNIPFLWSLWIVRFSKVLLNLKH